MLDADPSPQEEQSTHGLLLRLQAGDPAAAEELFGMHRERLLRALHLRLPREDRALEHEDLVQETLLAALRGLDRFEWRGQGAFLAWLMQIASHKLLDAGRRAGVRPEAQPIDPWGDGSRAGFQPIDAGRTPGAALERAEEFELLRRGLAQLSDQDRELLVRRKCLGQDYASLAQDLAIPSGTARMRVRRALVALSRWAERHGGAFPG